MKCLVFSDSHGNLVNMRAAIRANSDAEVVFFLGDGLGDADTVALGDRSRAWLAVAGNWDVNQIFRDGFVMKTDSVTLEGTKIVFTHGDVYRARGSLAGLQSLAAEKCADIVLFGHTHEPLERYIPTERGGYYLFNPGSIGAGSYGLSLLTESGVLLSHGRI